MLLKPVYISTGGGGGGSSDYPAGSYILCEQTGSTLEFNPNEIAEQDGETLNLKETLEDF